MQMFILGLLIVGVPAFLFMAFGTALRHLLVSALLKATKCGGGEWERRSEMASAKRAATPKPVVLHRST
jgi:hypothetical protein